MKRLPVKSLIRFRSLSKTWKSLIDSSQFFISYSAQGTQVQHLFVDPDYRYCYKEKNYFLIVDDETFPRHKVSVPFPQDLKYCYICGCSNGLLCIFGSGGGFVSQTIGRAVVWNLSIRKAVDVVVPNMGLEDRMIYESNLGFGVCLETMDPKIVKIRHIKKWDHIESVVSIPCQVEVFTLSTGAWRSSYKNLPRKSIQFNPFERVLEVDGFLYWLATDRILAEGGFRYYNLIVSFDLASEEFTEVKLPDSLADEDNITRLSMYKLRESLVIVHERRIKGSCRFYTVWTMEDGVSKSFTKPFDIKTPDAYLRGFRTGGEPVIEISDSGCQQLAVYDPQSKHISNLGIDGSEFGFQVFPYMETMLLLDHPGSVLYSDIWQLKGKEKTTLMFKE